jgi:hypothetical protein
MGNNIQGGLNLDELFIYLQTNEAYYNPGSFVSGAVYLDVHRPVTIYNVELKIRGTERVKWEELRNDPKGDVNKITEKMKDKQAIFNASSPLQVAPVTLAPGQYQYPFSFQLPDQIPGTFEIKHFDYDGRIRYTLTAVLNCAHREPIKYRAELVVRQRPTMANYNSPVTAEEDVCVCCSNKGKCSMTCNFQSDTYQPGNDAVLMTTVDNSICTLAIRNFTVSLIQHVNFRMRNGKTTNFTRNVRTNEFPGVPSHSCNRGNPKLMSIKLEEPKFESGKVIQPSVHGMMITCRYELEVRPVFDASCSFCARVPVITVPLYLYAPELQNWISAIPQGFQPKVFDVCNIIVPVPSVKLDLNMPFISAQVTESSSLPKPHVSAHSGGISMNVSGTADRANVNVGGGNISMRVGEDLKVGDANVHVGFSGPGMTMHVSGPTTEIPGAKARVGMKGPKAHIGMPSTSLNMQVNAEAEMPGGHMHMEVPGGNVKVEVHGDPQLAAEAMNMGMPGFSGNVTMNVNL